MLCCHQISFQLKCYVCIYDDEPHVTDSENAISNFCIKGITSISVSLLLSTGGFEITEGGKVKCSGRIIAASPEDEILKSEANSHSTWEAEEDVLSELNSEDIYKELRLRGYEYGGIFRGIVKAKAGGR